ncbi:hypothetical protein ACFWM1_26405 [Nocardia sp. NPDC058379]|uniref:hypothetical protein n=1 Tax=unclassified Nocardia TaxID=2637762 RepID=UPI003645FBFC
MSTSSSTYTLFVDGRVHRRQLSLDEGLDHLDLWLDERRTASPVLTVKHRLDAITVTRADDRDTTAVLVPHDPTDVAAYAALYRARLQRRWPGAAFTIRSTRPWNESADVAVSWFDGPAVVDVERLITPRHRIISSRIHTDRHYSTHGWEIVAALAQTHPAVTVPRTEVGDIDWAAAEKIRPAPEQLSDGDQQAPIIVSGLAFHTDEEPPLNLAEILVRLGERIDLSRTSSDTVARVSAPRIEITDPASLRVDLGPDGTALVVGFLRLEAEAFPCAGTYVPGFDLPRPVEDDGRCRLIAVIEQGVHEVLDVAEDGTITSRHAGSGTGNIPTRVDRWWELHAVDPLPGTGDYILTRRPVTYYSTFPPRPTVANPAVPGSRIEISGVHL